MDWVEEHCENLRSKLQNLADGGNAETKKGHLKVPWPWVCRGVIETVKRYPSGLTEAVILAELELLWRRDIRGAFVPGKLQAYLDAQYAPLSDVVQAGVVRHADQLVTLVEDHTGSISYGLSPATVDMYLHQNFKPCGGFVEQNGHDLLAAGRKIRLTGIRMLTGASVRPGSRNESGRGRRASGPAGSTLLLTEYLAFVLDHRKSEDLRLAADAFGQTRVTDTFHEKANEDPYFVVCKVVEIRGPRQHQDRTAGASRRRRLTVQTIVLECARGKSMLDEETLGSTQVPDADDGGRSTVFCHLWDDQMCLTSLFRKGDGLAIYWPWVVQSDIHDIPSGGRMERSQPQSLALPSQATLVSTGGPPAVGWHYEYGSATAFFVLPRESRGPLLAAANSNTQLDATGASGVLASDRDGLTGHGLPAEKGGGCAKEIPTDEKGIKDARQFPRRIPVADVAPNMVNLSVYGQVVSVSVPDTNMPAVVPPRQPAAGGHSQPYSSNQQPRPLLLLPTTPAGSIAPGAAPGVQMVELGIRDSSGEIRVLCCGREAVTDALACRPGHCALACGLRTFTRATPVSDYARGDLVVLCGEMDEFLEGLVVGDDFRSEKRLPHGSGGNGGREGRCRILNSSSLEGLLHCPFLSRHSLLHSEGRRTPTSSASFACKVAITWAGWAFAGDGLWAVHRLCRTRLPCNYAELGASAVAPKLAGTKRWRDAPKPGAGRNKAAKEVQVLCPLCKCLVRVASTEDAKLGYAPLLLALDDGSRCVLAECRDEVVASALGGIHAHAFFHMTNSERTATLNALTGLEIRCVVGTNGTDYHTMKPDGEESGADGTSGATRNNSSFDATAAKYRVERIANPNPAADLAHALSEAR